MPRYRVLFPCLLILLSLLTSTDLQADSGRQKLVIDPAASGKSDLFTVKEQSRQSLLLDFNLPALEVEEVSVAGDRYQVLSIPGGDLRGDPGQSALPAVSRLIAVPDHVAVQVNVVAKREKIFQDYRLLTVPREEGDEAFAAKAVPEEGRPEILPVVEVGSPAIMHGLRVVPLTINPVSFEAATGQVTVTSNLQLEIEFTGQDTRNAVAPSRTLIPQSFHQMYQDVVVNYRADAVHTGPGSYLIVAPNISQVLTDLQPLVEWRQRQGYNVILAHTGETGTSSSAIKSYLQNAFNTLDPPLEFVVLAGDAGGSYSIPCWYETLSGYGGEGDHYYTNLAGGDLLADVHLGRLSFRSLAELQGIVNKIITYETAPPTADAGWFTRAALTGDPGASGITTVWVNQWVKSHLLNMGYTQIDTIFSGNFTSLMMASLNQGCSAFGYRGYLGMSGFTSGSASVLTNGMELPYVLIPTCSTGSFADDVSCRSEAFLRNPSGGGIGAIGTATIGTHTRYNNCYYMGAWDGALLHDDHRLGVSHSYGKLRLYDNYINYESSRVEIWSMWNNLMGDPATPMWTAFPSSIDADHVTALPLGASSLEVTVSEGSLPVTGALVAVVKAGELRSTGFTDINGRVNLPLAAYTSGPLLVTVTKHNCLPYRGSVNVGTVGTFPSLAQTTIDDDATGGSSGNGDGVVNPAETIELAVSLQNLGTAAASAVTATLSSGDPYVTIIDGSEDFGDIPAGGTVWSGEDFDFSVAPEAPAGHVLELDLVATSGGTEYTSLIQIPVSSAAFTVQNVSWSGPGGDLDPGESGLLTITLRNDGDIPANGISAFLATESPWVVVDDPDGSFGTIDPGVNGTNTTDQFGLTITPDCFQGHLATLTLTLTFNGAALTITEFNLVVGSISSDDPVGPDAYGYYAFDNTDTGYPHTPAYNWIEIDPNYGGSGTSVGLTDFGWEQDDVAVMDLPFTFPYYGTPYDQITICSNGWISMGVTSLKPYRNFTIPSIGAPPDMIACYWDNLYQVGANQVYYYEDVENSRYIVQWSRMRADYNNQTQNVQLILFDPAVYQTSTGDGQILFQYHTVTNGDSRDGYVTVGIQNNDHTDGLLYTYGANYASGAAPLSPGRAIMFIPYAEAIDFGQLAGMVTNASDKNEPLAGVSIRLLGSSWLMTSQADGSYVGNVEAGIYDIRAEHPSFSPATVQDVVIQVDETVELDFALVDVVGPAILNTSSLPFTEDTEGPYIVQTTITDYSTIAAMRLYYRVLGGAVNEVTLDPAGGTPDLFQGEIPGHPLGSQIEYWIEATDVAGNASRDPEGEGYYSFWILQQVISFDDDMETDQGWTVGAPGDAATTGIWVRTDPIGVYNNTVEVQPEDDASPAPGVNCWITGNNENGYQGTDDVDNGQTTLNSPVFDLTGASHVTVSYRRWYTNDTGSNPGTDIWLVQVNDGSGWLDLENTNLSDRSWALQTILLDDLIQMTDTVQFRFIAADLDGGSVVEAGIDEFVITGFGQPISPVGEESAPTRWALHQNHPNPFNPMTTLSFDLPRDANVTLSIFDVSGRLVRTLVGQERRIAGQHQVTWNGRDDRGRQVPSGIYFYKLVADDFVQTNRMVLVR